MLHVLAHVGTGHQESFDVRSTSYSLSVTEGPWRRSDPLSLRGRERQCGPSAPVTRGQGLLTEPCSAEGQTV